MAVTVTLSIVVLTYNRARLLQDCLRSLLSQRYPAARMEILVIDDGSSDGTASVVRELSLTHQHLRYVHQPHRGIASARNNGVKHARGEIIAIVADDYVFRPDYADVVTTFFREHLSAQVVRFKMVPSRSDLGSRISHFYFDGSVKRRLYEASQPPPRNLREQIALLVRCRSSMPEAVTTRHNLEAAGAAAFRREVFEVAGTFDERLHRAEDTDMTRRLRALGIDVYYVPWHEVKHQYGRFLGDSLYKTFVTGFNRYKYYQKHASVEGASAIRTVLFLKIGFVLDVLWKTRQARSVGEVFLFLPFMVVFEVTNKLGFVVSWLLSRFSRTPMWPRAGHVR